MKKIALSAIGALAAGAALFAAPQAAQAQFLSVGFGGSNYYGYGSGVSVGFGSSYGYPYSGYGYGYSPVSYYGGYDGYYGRPVVTRRVVYRAPRTVVRRVVYGSPRGIYRNRVVYRDRFVGNRFYAPRRSVRVVRYY